MASFLKSGSQTKSDSKRSKRQHESSSSETDPDALSEMISRLLDEKLADLRTQLNVDLAKTVSDTVDGKLVPLWETVGELEKDQDELSKELRELVDRVAKLEAENVNLRKAAQESLRMCNDMEQYTRKYSFRVTGWKAVEENPATSIVTLLQQKLHMASVNLADIAIAHPLPKPTHSSPDEPSPIYFRLSNLNLRQEILKKRKVLKGSGVAIRDDLTKLNVQLLNRVNPNKCENVDSSWFHNGKVLLRPKGVNKTVQIRPFQDLAEVLSESTSASAHSSNRTLPLRPPRRSDSPR